MDTHRAVRKHPQNFEGCIETLWRDQLFEKNFWEKSWKLHSAGVMDGVHFLMSFHVQKDIRWSFWKTLARDWPICPKLELGLLFAEAKQAQELSTVQYDRFLLQFMMDHLQAKKYTCTFTLFLG